MEATKTAQRTSLIRPDTIQRLLAFGGLIALIVVFSLASPFFLKPDNIGGILLATAVNGILALGVTFVIINGGIDLSVGTVMTFSAVMTAQVMIIWQQPVLVGILAGLLTGALCGTAQRVDGHQDEDTALCGDAGHAVCHQRPFPGRFSIEAHLLQRRAHLQSNGHELGVGFRYSGA